MLDFYKPAIEILFGFSLILNAILYFMQAMKLFKNKDSSSLSLFSFLGFNLIQFLGVLHSYIIEAHLPMLGWLASLITCSLITVLIVFYNYKNNITKNIDQGIIQNINAEQGI